MTFAIALAATLLVASPPETRADGGPDREADVLAFVGAHQPELAKLLETLKPMNAREYGKAIRELAPIRDRLVELERRNPPRYRIALDAWKAKTRVDLLSAQMASEPSPDLEAKLRAAIADRLDVEIRQHQHDIDQAEAALKQHRKALERLEKDRNATLEARFRAAQPRKNPRVKRPAEGKVAPVPSAPAPAPGGNRR